ncbi:MAG: sensor histidine kinase, partial [Acidimicrobiia bacterium]|nr:sensor histidine kinase [Acidimicrobiia bacterium]
DAPTSSLPTLDELQTLVNTMRAAGLAVNWTRTGAPRTLAPAVSLAGYRIAQEALTNAAKHGHGEAELATEWDDSGLTIRVANETTTETGAGGGQGLVGMHERASVNGGRLVAEPSGRQFVVEAWLPALTTKEATS